MENSINWLAIITSAIITFVIGAFWYGPLFGKVWMKERNFTEEMLRESNLVKIYGLAFILQLIIAINLAFFLNGLSVGEGTFYGFLAGFGWVAMAMGINYLFNRNSLRLWLIDSFYFVVTFTMMGFILTWWT